MQKVILIKLILMISPMVLSLEKIVINYQTDKTPLQGVFYKPEVSKTNGAILLVHEWYGLNTYAKFRAEQLAKMGYPTFAIDLYGAGKRANHPKEAKQFMLEATKDTAELSERFLAAINVLTSEQNIDKEKLVAIGYCFGGGVVLNMARQGIDLKAVASFHGGLSSPLKANKDNFKAIVLVANGGADPMVPKEDVINFVAEMQQANADYELINFPKAKHSFTVKAADEMGKKYDLPLAYNEEADQVSFKALTNLLERTL